MAIIEGNYIHFREHGETLLFHLHQLYTYNMFLDACLVCNGSEIFAHKSVLAAASPLLKERLFEFGDCHHVRIEIELELLDKSVNADDIKLLVEFIYKGQVCVPQPRLPLFLELGNHFQILGLYKQAPSIGCSLSYFNQPSFPAISNIDTFCYDDLSNIQTDYLSTSFPNAILSPDKLHDNVIKPDKSLSVSVTNSTFSDLCIENSSFENFNLLSDRGIDQNDELNPKLSYDFENIANTNSYSEVFHSSIIPLTAFSECSQIQSDHSKDIFEDSCPSPGATDPDILFDSFANHPNSFFATPDLESINAASSPCLNDEDFQQCKASNANNLPERQVRLKVKDSIGGVSLQDTSLGDIKSKLLQIETLSDSLISSKLLSTIDVSDSQFEIRDDSYEAIEVIEPLQKQDTEQSCSQCPEKLPNAVSLTEHMLEKHNIGKQYPCLLCSFKTAIENKLVEHGKSHSKLPDLQCCICGKKFKTRSTLRNHLSCHTAEKLFKCTMCNAHYNQKNNLLRHMASEHRLDTGGSPLKEKLNCTDCNFQTWAPHKLDDHKVRCHTKDKAFKCTKCSYSSTERNAFNKHFRTHTQERPYICDSCGLSFITVSSLKRHSRSHTKEKPYSCKDCGQKYADKKRLRDHYLKHKSVKPFKCPYCEYHCRRKDNLQSHIKRTHSAEVSSKHPMNLDQDIETSVSCDIVAVNINQQPLINLI